MNTPKLSRQYQLMIRRKKKGLCIIYAKPAAKLKFRMGTSRTSCMCEEHLALNRKRMKTRKKIDGETIGA